VPPLALGLVFLPNLKVRRGTDDAPGCGELRTELEVGDAVEELCQLAFRIQGPLEQARAVADCFDEALEGFVRWPLEGVDLESGLQEP